MHFTGALDSVVVEIQELFSSHGGNHIKLTNYDETKKMAHVAQIVSAKETLKLSFGGASQF